MSWITLNADMRDVASALDRIASALERISPPPLPESPPPSPGTDAEPPLFHMSESPEQYHERTSHEAELAISLGVAPWSPAFQRAVDEMRSDLIRPRMEVDEQGQATTIQYTREQADDIIRQSFRTAKAEANQR